MSLAKRELERLEGLRSDGKMALVKAGALKECDYHEDILIDQGDSDAVNKAYAIGTNMEKAGEVDGTREEFMAAIKHEIENSYIDCPYCAKAFDE